MHTRLCDLLGIEYPIIQAGMGPFTSYDLAAAVSSAGALGTIGAARRSASDLREQIGHIRARTDRPFAVNFLVTDLDEESFAIALEARVPVISFALGDPGNLVQRAHEAGALVVQQVHTVDQAQQASERGSDALIAQGGEAGGFGQFVGTMALVPQVVDAMRPLPVVAAGGIADGRGIAAALVLGADGVNLGTRFLASTEASIAEAYKQAIVAARSDDAVKVDFWNDLSARPGRSGYGTVPRAIRTAFIDQWTQRRSEIAEQAEGLYAEVTTAAVEGRMHEYVPFAGQTVGLIHEVIPAAEIVRRLVEETNEALRGAATLMAS